MELIGLLCMYIGFIDFVLKGKSLADFTFFFSVKGLKESDDIILNYFCD